MKWLARWARRDRLYRGDRPPPAVRGRTVILVDDGLATAATMHAAFRALRQAQAARIVVAVPTAPPRTCEALEAGADEVIYAITPEPFYAVRFWYADFSQTTDDDVVDLLRRAWGQVGRRRARSHTHNDEVHGGALRKTASQGDANLGCFRRA